MFKEKDGYFQLKEFEELGVNAIYTTVEMGNFQDDHSREEALEKLNIKDRKVYSGHQTHSDNIKIIRKDSDLYSDDTDGFITNEKDVVIFTKYADCLPLFFFDKKTKAFGCIHSGWEGSYKGIGLKAIELLEKEFNVKKENLRIGIGIGISVYKYEVQRDFYLKFKEKYSKEILKDVFLVKNGNMYFDNGRFNYNLFINAGVKSDYIYKDINCTFTNEKFHSYRRDKNHSGRNGAYIFLDKSM